MIWKPISSLRHCTIFVPGVIASVFFALVLTGTFAQPGYFSSTLLAFWVELLVGPVKYWLPILIGFPDEYKLHPMTGVSTCLYAACLALTLAHPFKPCILTGWMTVIAFTTWYSWAFLTLAAYECP